MNKARIGDKHMSGGYVCIKTAGHPRPERDGWIAEHVLVVERILGRYLDSNHPIHHVNGIKTDNRPENLVVCEDPSYHILLHKRARIIEAGGDPETQVLCGTCHQLKLLNQDFSPSRVRRRVYTCHACAYRYKDQARKRRRERNKNEIRSLL
jgi:HNH endonuclease